MRKGFVSAVILAGLLLLPNQCLAESFNLNIVGATLNGTVNAGYAAFAQAFMKAYPGSNVNIMPGGAVANPTRVNKNEGAVSHTQTLMLRAAAAGVTPYQAAMPDLMSMFMLGDEARVHFIAREGAPFKTLEEIRDKKLPIVLATSPKGTTNELYGRWVLEAAGFTYEDIKAWGGKINSSAYSAVVDLMKNNQVDMLIWVGPGVPSFMQEVALSQKIRWIPLSDAVLSKVEKDRHLKRTVIKATEFGGLIGEDTPCVTDYTELFTSKNVPDDLVYAITRVWQENYKQIRDANPGWSENEPEKVWQGVTLPMHPGSQKYFREAGLMK